jgi:hypothetical protein
MEIELLCEAISEGDTDRAREIVAAFPSIINQTIASNQNSKGIFSGEDHF